jgi:sugar phosphate isomerase/epimerase
MYPDQSLYPADSVPNVVKRINNALMRADQLNHAEGDDSVNWMAPIVADAEAGFGGVLNAHELMKMMIEAGAAGVHFEDQLASAKKCGHMGGKVLVLGSPQQRNLLPGVEHAKAMQLAADCLRQVAPVLESCEVTLAVEPLAPAEGDFLNTADLGVELIEMVDSPAVRLHLDVKAMSSEPTPVPEIIRRHAGLLEHFHANDPNLLGPGMGEVEFEPIFAALKEVDYQGWVSVEVFDFKPGAENIARQSIEYMKRCAS